MNVLSLFDGISCGRLALERAGIKVDKYYASEIDKYCLKISEKNHPDNIQLGDINNWINWDIKMPDLIIGGSPCQGFSFAGKQLAFDDPRSKLFWQFVALVNFCKPKYFLLENVKMKKEYLDIISEHLGVEPICINSSLVSAQNRVRYYWTNIPGITQPEDKKIYLKDIIEHGVVDKDKSYCIDANYWKGGNLKSYFEKHRRQLVFDKCDQNGRIGEGNYGLSSRVYSDLGKSPTLMTHTGGNHHVKVLQRQRGFNKGFLKECEKSPSLTSNSWEHNNKLVLQTSERGRRLTQDGEKRDDKNGTMVRGYEVRPDGKTCALTTVQKDNYVTEDFIIRKLTPVECERLQTLPDDYTAGVSNTQRYKAIGNAWTVDVIAHILSHIKKEC